MKATLLVLLSLAASAAPPEATTVSECVTFALEDPGLFTHRLVGCARPLSSDALLDGVDYEHEREAVTERIRLVLWRYALEPNHGRFAGEQAERWLEALELHAPKDPRVRPFLLQSLMRSFGERRLLAVRARKKFDAFGRACALAAVGPGATDPDVIELVWNAWLDAPDEATSEVIRNTYELRQRLRKHMEALRKAKQAPRWEDFDLARWIEFEWVWDELLFWSASEHPTAAFDAISALMDKSSSWLSPVPELYRANVRAALLAHARESKDSTKIEALRAWTRLADRQPSRAEFDLALELAQADPLTRQALVPIFAAFAANEPIVRPLLFDALFASSRWDRLEEQMVEAPRAACWLPAALLPRLRALTSPEAPEWQPTVELANALVENVWNRRMDARPADDGGGSGIGYCSSYVGGPSHQAVDAEIFGLDRKAFDLLHPGMGWMSSTPEPESKKQKAERVKYEARYRKAQRATRDALVRFLSDPPPLPAIHDCGRDGSSAHLTRAPTGDAPRLVLDTGRLPVTDTPLEWVLEAPDGGVAARGTLSAKFKSVPIHSPGSSLPLFSPRAVPTDVNDWYQGPGTYTLSFPETKGREPMTPWSFPVDAVDERLTIGVRAGSGGRDPTEHALTRQRSALEEVSVTLDWKDGRAVVRIVNGSPDALLPSGKSWRDVVQLVSARNALTTPHRDTPGHDELAPGAELEIELGARTTAGSGDVMAIVSFVPAVADLPEDVVWVARSKSTRPSQ